MSGAAGRESLSRRLGQARSAPGDVLMLLRRLALEIRALHRRGLACDRLDPDSIRIGPGDDVHVESGPGGSPEADMKALGALLRKAFPDPPPSVAELCRRCERGDATAVRSMGTVVLMLDQAVAAHARQRLRHGRLWRSRLALASVVLLGAVMAMAGASLLAPGITAAGGPTPIRLRLTTGLVETSPFEGAAAPLLSPDGSQVVFRQEHNGGRMLARHRLDTGDRRPLPHLPTGAIPFSISPDGRELAYVWRLPGDPPALYAAPLDGGPSRHLAASSDRGASWGEDGRIVFTPDVRSGLFTVPARGGEPTPLTRLDTERGDLSHRWPFHLPDGRGVLFTIAPAHARSFSDAVVAVLDGRTGEVKRLLEGGMSPQFLPPGRLVYAREGGLMAVAFDLESLAVTGAPERVLDGISMIDSIGAARYSLARDGTLAYLAAAVGGGGREMYRMAPGGEPQPFLSGRRAFATFDVSPDGRQVAVTINDFHDDVWLHDLDRGTLTRLTFGSPSGAAPRWSADGRRVAFVGRIGGSGEGGEGDIFWAPFDGNGPIEPLVAGPGQQTPMDFTPDGRLMLYSHAVDGSVRLDALELDGAGRTLELLPGTPPVLGAQVDPTGRWAAYRRGDLEDTEVGLVSLPDGGRVVPLLRGAFWAARWSPSGDLHLAELNGVEGQRLLVLDDAVSLAESGSRAEPRVIMAGSDASLFFDVSQADGSLFFVRVLPIRWQPWIHLVLNWRGEQVGKEP